MGFGLFFLGGLEYRIVYNGIYNQLDIIYGCGPENYVLTYVWRFKQQ